MHWWALTCTRARAEPGEEYIECSEVIYCCVFALVFVYHAADVMVSALFECPK